MCFNKEKCLDKENCNYLISASLTGDAFKEMKFITTECLHLLQSVKINHKNSCKKNFNK